MRIKDLLIKLVILQKNRWSLFYLTRKTPIKSAKNLIVSPVEIAEHFNISHYVKKSYPYKKNECNMLLGTGSFVMMLQEMSK